MKNLFNKNAKVIATTALAAVITISMSFTSQEKIEASANETQTSIQDAQIKNVSQAKWPAAVGASAAAVGTLVQVANFATNYFFGGGKAMNDSANEKDLINSEQIKVSQFD